LRFYTLLILAFFSLINLQCAQTDQVSTSQTQSESDWILPARFEGQSALDHEIIVTLHKDQLFFLWMGPKVDTTGSYSNQALPLAYSDLGTFRVDSANHQLILEGQGESTHNWRITSAKRLTRLNNLGQPVPADHPTELLRTPSFHLLERPVKMTGDFLYYADAASFTESITGKRWPVWMDSTYLEAERYYLEYRKEPMSPMQVKLKGHLEMKPAMEGDRRIPYLIIDKVLGWQE
jgi:hypothetical protein